MTKTDPLYSIRETLVDAFMESARQEFAMIPEEDEIELSFSDGFFDDVSSSIEPDRSFIGKMIDSRAKKGAVAAAVILLSFGALMTFDGIREPVFAFIHETYEKTAALFGADPETIIVTPPDSEKTTEVTDTAPGDTATLDETESADETTREVKSETYEVINSDTSDTPAPETSVPTNETDITNSVIPPLTPNFGNSGKTDPANNGSNPNQNNVYDRSKDAENRANPTETGQLENGVTWSFDPIKAILVIEGSGDVVSDASNTPFEEVRNKAITLVVKDGITGIGDGAFYGSAKLYEAFLPSSVSKIGNQAFMSCDQLRSVNIPSSVTTIGAQAFANDAKLNKAEIPYGVTSIEKKAFYGCSSLISISLPTTVTYIGEGAFKYCTYVQELTVSGSAEIGKEAFAKCTALKAATVGISAGGIGDSAFNACTNLREVTVTGSGQIGKCAFADCTALVSAVFDGEISGIGNGAFESCRNLLEFSAVCSGRIGKRAFAECSHLHSASFFGDASEIGVEAFYGCRSLSELTIPGSITVIANGAFYRCLDLRTVHITGSDPESWAQIEAGIGGKNDNFKNAEKVFE